MIVDTSALSAAADDDPAVIAILARADQMAIPAIVLGEYRYGITQSRHRATYENWLSGLLRDCAVLDIDEPTTEHYAEIILELRRLDLKRKGKPNSHQRPLDCSPLPPALARC
jgi:tRNA(fMet)-specific endonuclease VapC